MKRFMVFAVTALALAAWGARQAPVAGQDKAAAGDKGWVQLCSQGHNNQSTVVPVGNKVELKFTPKTRETLYNNFSPLRFSDPVYYGLFGTHQACRSV